MLSATQLLSMICQQNLSSTLQEL
ncbi:uncharacterized protein METZ01_LOCUS89459 [marine metagenome]|uniref:Uncharacterized protein n=1 Tax=marine metagenome TaxID=408172 RepID=A0A381V888_9ZZZZ